MDIKLENIILESVSINKTELSVIIMYVVLYFVVIIYSLLFITNDLSHWQDLQKVFLSMARTELLDIFKIKAFLSGKDIHPFHWAIFKWIEVIGYLVLLV